jgi:hypothetical protein
MFLIGEFVRELAHWRNNAVWLLFNAFLYQLIKTLIVLAQEGQRSFLCAILAPAFRLFNCVDTDIMIGFAVTLNLQETFLTFFETKFIAL